MQTKWMFVYAAVLGFTSADPVHHNCTVPPTQGTFNDVIGSKMYITYTNLNIPNIKSKFGNSLTVKYSKLEEINEYNLTIGGIKNVSLTLSEYPSEQKLVATMNGIQGDPFYYSIPFLENNVSAVFYFCSYNGSTEIDVCTTNLDNDVTKALEVANKLSITNLNPYS